MYKRQIHTRYEDTGESMSDEKIVDELITLIQAGHDTTATTLAWITYLLAKHPLKQQKLLAELAKKEVQNEYLNAVIHESMRLYPTSWLVERTAMADDQFGEYLYPKGTMIIGFYYGLHRSPQLWENALTFNPERFVADPKLATSKKFYPFGAGPRKCIGLHFAMAEMAYFMTALIQQFELTTNQKKPKISALATLRPDKILVNIKRR